MQLDKPYLWQAVVIVLALGYTAATGPFRAPDEPHHFFRAYQISEGHLIARRLGGDFLGDQLPTSLEKTTSALSAYPNPPAIATSREGFSRAWKVKLKKETRAFILFPGAALHSPFVYLPATLAISVGRFLHARPLTFLYTARCLNAILAGGLIGLALSRVWRQAPYLVALALTPMCLFQVGTLTADALTFGIVFLWCSEILRAQLALSPPRSLLSWTLLALGLSQLRFPYPLLGLLVFAVPSPNRLRFYPTFLAALFLPSLLWISMVQSLRVQMRPLVEVDPAGQLQYVLAHPIQFFASMGAEIARSGYEFWRQAVGVFGWLSLPVPTWILFGVTLTWLVTMCSSRLELTRKARSAYLVIFAVCSILTVLVAYMAWNAVGSARVEGWQGRYAIPLLPLLAAGLANNSLRGASWLKYCAIAFSLLANVASIVFLARASYF